MWSASQLLHPPPLAPDLFMYMQATSHRSQRDTEVAQQESKSDGAAQEQDALHNKLQHLESQILRGRGIPNKVSLATIVRYHAPAM